MPDKGANVMSEDLVNAIVVGLSEKDWKAIQADLRGIEPDGECDAEQARAFLSEALLRFLSDLLDLEGCGGCDEHTKANRYFLRANEEYEGDMIERCPDLDVSGFFENVRLNG